MTDALAWFSAVRATVTAGVHVCDNDVDGLIIQLVRVIDRELSSPWLLHVAHFTFRAGRTVAWLLPRVLTAADSSTDTTSPSWLV